MSCFHVLVTLNKLLPYRRLRSFFQEIPRILLRTTLLKEVNLIVVEDANLVRRCLLLLDEVFVADQVSHRRLALWRVNADCRWTDGGTPVFLGRIAQQIFICTLFMGTFGIISTHQRLLRKHALIAQLVPVLLQDDCFVGILT